MVRRRGPSDDQLQRLKALRLAGGLSLETVADRTGLPVAHVEALEEARIEELPAGPYVGAYYRLVRGVVGGADEDDEVETFEPEPTRALPVWAARTLAFVSVALLGSLVVWQVANGGLAGAVDAAGGMVAGAPTEAATQVVVMTVNREAEFRVIVDGETALNGTLPSGATRTFTAEHRVEIDVGMADDARFRFNGRTIVPQGRQGRPRTLIFTDDTAATGRR